MYVVLSMVLIIVGGVMIGNPRLFYDITESWKHNRSVEPSDWYLFHTRLGGVVFVVVGVVGVLIQVFF